MSSTPDPQPMRWVKSTYSGGEGQCIEWAPAHAHATGEFLVRDSKDPHGPALTFESSAWSLFVTAVKGGEFPV
ncbi:MULTISPECIES: DUF397 domain-containing protein [Streptomyces]|uniref:DUF397 domain-containing protein n=1 Tax=Streptomyces TaxID=1883 RepID=UPI00069AF9D7|nr:MULTISPECIES: DUF397 domain-containing protein [Streptomyces]MYU57410.1 DUF397 domain-containing protein [Streptomyces sp. SID7805]